MATSVVNGKVLPHRWVGIFWKGRVLLYVFLVFFQRRRSDGARFASGQRRFEHIGSVNGSLGRARSDNRMDFINK